MNDQLHQSAPHARAEPYCFLCQTLVPRWPCHLGRPVKEKDWESDDEEWEHYLVAIYAQSPVVRASRLTLPGRNTNHDHYPRLQDDAVKFCLDRTCLGRHGDVHTAHQDCWSVARGHHVSLTSLLSLAQGRRHILPLKNSTRPRARIVFDRGNQDTPLGQTLRGVSRLPVELQDVIAEFLGGHFVRCLLLASMAMPYADEKPTLDTLLWQHVALPGCGRKLKIRTTQILGLEYISDISLVDGEGVSTRDMRGIRFALDTFGLRGIRVMYKDQSMSPWLGNPLFSWYGEVYGSNEGQLQIIRDAYRVIRIDFEPDHVSEPLPVLPRQLWSQESALDTKFNYTAADLEMPGPSLAFYSGWALYPYISFGTDDDYMSGVTVYCTPGGICGLATHGRNPQSIGTKAWTPLHVPLQPRERIVSVWVGTHGPPSAVSRAGPYLLIKTSLGRSYFLGHYYLLITPCYVHWTRLIDNALVVGLSLLGRSMIGAAWNPSSDASAAQPATILRAGSVPPIAPGMKITSGFLSTATLAQTSRLQLRREGGRCCGLLVDHFDGSTEVLGAWDPAHAEGISTIYEASKDGPLERIAFQYTDFKQFHRVTSVLALTGSLTAPEGYREFSTTPIAWWFSRLFDDVLEWQGRSEPVHEILRLKTSTIRHNIGA